jgi:hypothetical protein
MSKRMKNIIILSILIITVGILLSFTISPVTAATVAPPIPGLSPPNVPFWMNPWAWIAYWFSLITLPPSM